MSELQDIFAPYQFNEFSHEGRVCYVVKPTKPAAGNPWIWRARFFAGYPEADLALLAQGFHLAHIDIADMFGAPVAVKHFDSFYRLMTEQWGLASKVVLEGFSRGGLIVYNWAAENADKVMCIYADAPVCDIRSWPGGLGSGLGNPESWEKCLKVYGLNEDSVKNFKGNPIDKLEPIAKAGIPILHVCGDVDESVPIEENTYVLRDRYQSLGGNMTIIEKPGVGHHPHSLDPPDQIVDFILKVYKSNLV